MTDEKQRELIEESDERYKQAVDGWAHIYEAALDDLRFVYDVDGGQWDPKISDDRKKDNRPIITLNKLLKFIRQVRGDKSINKPTVKVIPVDDKADVEMAEIYNGLIRQIEYLSAADVAYDTAYLHSVSGGVGFFRLITDYADDMSFDQDIYIKRIINPFTVHYDPSATEFTLSDARYCFIEDSIPKKTFQKLYPSAQDTNFEGDLTGMQYTDWFANDRVKVAEYFYKEPTKKKIVQLRSGEIVELTKDITIEYLTKQGITIDKEREINSHKVMWFKRSFNEILEGPTEWAGKDIPIIPVFGDEVVVNGKKYILSLIRGAKDPQRMYNYWATAATENVALSPKSPFIVDHKQLKGFEKEWDDSNKVNRMYLRYNTIAGVPKPQREPQTGIPTAIINMMQATAFDIEDHLGRYESSKGASSNERSGKAIMARVAQSDKGTFTFVDNLARAITYSGRQLIDLIPKIYDTHRALRIRGEADNEALVEVNKPVADGIGNIGTANDLKVGRYDLVATVGASFSSKRQEMVEYMIQSMQYAPALAPMIAPLIFKFSDWAGSQEVYGEIKKALDQAQQMQMQQQQNATGVAQGSQIPNIPPMEGAQ